MPPFALQPTCSCCGYTKGSSGRRNLQSKQSKAVVSTLKCILTEKFVSEDDIQLLLRGYVCRQCFSALQRYQKLRYELFSKIDKARQPLSLNPECDSTTNATIISP